MKISNVGEGELHFTEAEAKAAMLACGFEESSLDDMEVLAAYDPRGGVVECVVFSDVGTWAGSNADGWNNVNSLSEIGELSEADVKRQFGEDALNSPVWRAYLIRIAREQ